MGALDFLYATRASNPTAKEETQRADAAVRRVRELAAENAKLRHNLKQVRSELETLRRCLASGKGAP